MKNSRATTGALRLVEGRDGRSLRGRRLNPVISRAGEDAAVLTPQPYFDSSAQSRRELHPILTPPLRLGGSGAVARLLHVTEQQETDKWTKWLFLQACKKKFHLFAEEKQVQTNI